MNRPVCIFLLFVFIALAAIPASAGFFSWWTGDKEESAEVSVPPVVPEVVAPETLVGPAMPHDHPRQAVIAVIIDDMGVDIKRSARAIDLPAGVTLSFLPYARHLQAQADKGVAKGHFLMLHLPMQAQSASENAGPHALKTDTPPGQLDADIATNLDSFAGYMAVNNHMGSKFTENDASMRRLMAALKRRHLSFVDSRTSAKSVAVKAAQAEGVTVTSRDIFIDHVNDRQHIEAALKDAEKKALKHGHAIAIGHPRDLTLAALEAWLPTLKGKGIRLVPITNIPAANSR